MNRTCHFTDLLVKVVKVKMCIETVSSVSLRGLRAGTGNLGTLIFFFLFLDRV